MLGREVHTYMRKGMGFDKVVPHGGMHTPSHCLLSKVDHLTPAST
jgi:hypothetical protein